MVRMTMRVRLDRLEAIWQADPLVVEQASHQIALYLQWPPDDDRGPVELVAGLQTRYGLDETALDAAFAQALRRLLGLSPAHIRVLVDDVGLAAFLAVARNEAIR
jgi:hypothetical protein